MEPGDSFTLTCVSNGVSDAIIRRGSQSCAECSGTYPGVCDEAGRTFNTKCEGNQLTINMDPAVDNDFTTWTCSIFEVGDSTESLQQYGMFIVLKWDRCFLMSQFVQIKLVCKYVKQSILRINWTNRLQSHGVILP